MGAMRLVFLPVAAAAGVYFFFFLRRMAGFFGADTKHPAVKTVLAVAGALCGGVSISMPSFAAVVMLHIWALAGLVDIIHLLFRFAAKHRHPSAFSHWNRLYTSGILPLAAALGVILFGYWNMNHVVQTDYTIHTQKAIRPEGYRVAMLSDIHYGISLDAGELARVCDQISAQEPDLVILCGDMVDNATSAEQLDEVFRVLGTIESAYGTFYVHGNHDRPMAQLASEYTQEELIRAITDNGITILCDTLYPVSGDFILAGRDDRGYGDGSGRMPVSELLAGADASAFILTLDHQPNEYPENGSAGTDLLLSGHTHGGQLWPANLVDRAFGINAAVYGHTQIDEDTQAIVSSGLAGWAWPIKTAAPAEYLMIEIVNP